MRSTKRAIASGKRHPTGRAERARAERARERQQANHQRPTRTDLQAQLEAARAAGDRQRVSQLLGRLMLTPHDRTPPGSEA